MHIWVHRDASYLTETKEIPQDGGYHYFSNAPKLPIQSDETPPKHNHHVLLLSKLIDAVTSSTQETETGGSYMNTK